MEVLKDKKYDGFISFEMLSMPDSGTAARKAFEFVEELDL